MELIVTTYRQLGSPQFNEAHYPKISGTFAARVCKVRTCRRWMVVAVLLLLVQEAEIHHKTASLLSHTKNENQLWNFRFVFRAYSIYSMHNCFLQ